jgi:hypothetical protein
MSGNQIILPVTPPRHHLCGDSAVAGHSFPHRLEQAEIPTAIM